MNAIVAYMQAGLDESLVKFIKGIFASAIVAGAEYAYRHYAGGLTLVDAVVGMVVGVPAIHSLWHWAKTMSVSSIPVVSLVPDFVDPSSVSMDSIPSQQVEGPVA